MHVPTQLGFMLGHLQDRRSRTWNGLIGFVVCFYAVCVGWLAAVLDGPGVVLNTLLLIGHLVDVSKQSQRFAVKPSKQNSLPSSSSHDSLTLL